MVLLIITPSFTHYVKCQSPWKLLPFFEWQSLCSSCAEQETVLPLHVLVVPPQMGEGKTIDSGPFPESVGKKELKQETWDFEEDYHAEMETSFLLGQPQKFMFPLR